MTDLEALEAELGSAPPASLAGLEPDELEDLRAAIREARRRQAAEVAAVGDRALSFVPRLLRGPIRAGRGMSAAVTGEVLKLARLLGREPESLQYLERLEAEDLRRLREQVTELLFSAHAGPLGRLAAASKLLPVGVTASIAQRALGPMLTARIAGMLEPAHAMQVAAKLPGPFLADVAAELDPRRAGEVIALIPAHQISEVTRELVHRLEHVTIGRFVGHLSAEARLAALAVLDHATRARVVFVVEDRDGLHQLFADVPPEERGALIDAADRAGLSAELLEIVGGLPEPLRESYLELAASTR